EKQSVAAIVRQLETAVKRGPLKVLAPLVKARKGFHTDVARWAERQGFDTLFVDGELLPISQFRKLERFKEHTIDVVVGAIDAKRILKARNLVQRALDIGRGTAHLLDAKHRITVMSTEMSCPGCGRAFEELDPRLFSFNSPHGACEECGGFGEIWNREKQTGAEDTGDSILQNELAADREFEWIDEDEAAPCPACHGSRLNPIARHVRLQNQTIDNFTALSAAEALELVDKLRFRGTHKTIADDLVPEISQRLRFMQNVGLGNAWRRSCGAGDAARHREAPDVRDGALPEESAESSHAQDAAVVRRSRAVDRNSGSARAQPEEGRCAISRGPALRHHGNFRFRQIDADALSPLACGKGAIEKRTRQTT